MSDSRVWCWKRAGSVVSKGQMVNGDLLLLPMFS
jgi:hypothetical protein